MEKKTELKHSLYIRPIVMLVIVIIGISLTFLIISLTYSYFTTLNGTILADHIPSPLGLGKGDWLSFWGCIFSALCTIVLACFALVQNVNLSKINDKKEKIDIFFAKKRFSAEFYSQIEFERIAFFLNGDRAFSIMFETKDVGRCPPSIITIRKFSIGRGDSVVIVTPETKEPCVFSSIEGEEVNVSSRKTTEGIYGHYKVYSISIPIHEEELGSFIELVNKIIVQNVEQKNFKKSSVFLFAKIEYELVNPLGIKTIFSGEMPLKAESYADFSIESIKQGGSFFFVVADLFMNTLVYEFTGNEI